MRPRWEFRTTSRGAACLPRGRAGERIACHTLYASGNKSVSTIEADPMTATAEPLTDAPSPATEPRHVKVGIVGAGFAGLGMAIRLKQRGINDFVVWERDAEVGGTWWANTYPGCQCDVPSHLYSFSFALNPDWGRTYATQPEIERYIQDVTDRYGLRPHIRTDCAVLDARWDAASDRWHVTTAAGEYTADVVVAGPGPLSEPSIPDLEALDTFEGTTFHTAAWNHDHALTGRRDAVIGTGASAIQAVPEIQPIVESLTVFQRTPPWGVPHRDRPITHAHRRVYPPLPPPVPRRGAARPPRAAAAPARRPRRRLLRPRAARRRPRLPPEAHGRAAEGRQEAPRQARLRAGPAPPPYARLRARLQAHPAEQPLVPRDHEAERRRDHVRHRPCPRGRHRRP